MLTSRQNAKSTPEATTLPLRKSCQSCNLAKLKCNGHRPQCARCSRRGTPCVYPPSKPVGRPPKHSKQRPSSVPALRGLRPVYNSSPSTPPSESFSELPAQSPQLEYTAGEEYSESYVTAALMALESGTRPEIDPTSTSLYTALDFSFLHKDRAGHTQTEEHQPMTPLTSGSDTYASSSTADDWCFDDLPDFVFSPTVRIPPASEPPLSGLQRSPAIPTSTGTDTSNTSTSSSLPVNTWRGRDTNCCPCLTTIINLLLHRNKMRRKVNGSTVEQQADEAALSRELEALMQQGLSVQQRCKLCLEDPLISMIWAKITDEYLTTVIASRGR
ncbi:hypothetical protein V8F20_004372, partial [Naviculisporaceae sp. PSN 640]